MPFRLAALLHDIGKPRTRRFEGNGRVSLRHYEVVGAKMTKKRMMALKHSNELTKDDFRLVELQLLGSAEGGSEARSKPDTPWIRTSDACLTGVLSSMSMTFGWNDGCTSTTSP